MGFRIRVEANVRPELRLVRVCNFHVLVQSVLKLEPPSTAVVPNLFNGLHPYIVIICSRTPKIS